MVGRCICQLVTLKYFEVVQGLAPGPGVAGNTSPIGGFLNENLADDNQNWDLGQFPLTFTQVLRRIEAICIGH